MAPTIGATARDPVFVSIRWWNDTWIVGVQGKSTAVFAGQRHVAVNAGCSVLVTANDMISIAFWLMVERPLFVTTAATQAWFVKVTVDVMADGAGDAVLDLIGRPVSGDVDGGFGRMTTQAFRCHLTITTVIPFSQVFQAIAMPTLFPGIVFLVTLVFAPVSPPIGGGLAQAWLGFPEIVFQGVTWLVTDRKEVLAVGGASAGVALTTDLGIEAGCNLADTQGTAMPASRTMTGLTAYAWLDKLTGFDIETDGMAAMAAL